MLRLTVITAFALLASACSNIEPWVKPYERDPVSGVYLAHVYGVREGSRGGQGGSGGGCGCN